MHATDHVTGLTQERLKELLHYDPETGIFTWVGSASRRVKNGDVAGSPHQASGYWKIKIGDRQYTAGRLAWLYMTGNLPIQNVDHHDLDKINNRWANLREANFSQNGANRKLFPNNTSGYKGVSFRKGRNCWQANIRVKNKLLFLGNHKTPELAADAYSQAAESYYGQFARSM